MSIAVCDIHGGQFDAAEARSMLLPSVMQFSGYFGVDLDLWVDQQSGALMFRYGDRVPDMITHGGDKTGQPLQRFMEVIEYHKQLNAKLEFEMWRRCTADKPAKMYRARKPIRGRFRRRMVAA